MFKTWFYYQFAEFCDIWVYQVLLQLAEFHDFYICQVRNEWDSYSRFFQLCWVMFSGIYWIYNVLSALLNYTFPFFLPDNNH